MKNKSLGFSLIGSLMIIILVVFINLLTSPNYLWSIYPAFAILWWPLSVFFHGNKRYKAMSVVASIFISLFFLGVNLISSPNYLWFIYPVFLISWWPISMLFGKSIKVMAAFGSSLIILFFLFVNYYTSPTYPWVIYPTFVVLWWPLSVFLYKKGAKIYSLLATLLIALFFITVNLITSPGYLWFIHIVLPLLWWPLSVFLAKKKTIKIYSLISSLLMCGYFVVINLLTSSILWFPYVVFPILLWPVIMFLGKKAASITFAVLGSVVAIGYYTLLNMFLSPAHPWIIYMILPILWWPVSIGLVSKISEKLFIYGSATIFMIYYSLINVFVSPSHPWSLYLLYPIAFIIIGLLFGRKKKDLAMAISGAIITITFFTITNWLITPETIWAVFPIFIVLWWPLSVYYFKPKNKAIKKETTT